ncbi:membrane protein [Pseudohongiella nitratireducens]|uniref:Membrane protein n=1 Tax=Pseudohongiella nitratireducens TaxID=1768907 RepID=A0A917GS79_9GAMM|nr:DMT family transporter [Pseudohongiella nitratireducens]MDF1622380.1 DMT family transporter [Pseudohongiella nitratireducens]GGG55035.1 membrane protein [Pseudohongiella nitratireducens]
MTGHTLRSAIILLIVGNALAVLSDVVIKIMGAGVPVFQFMFLRTVLTVGVLLPFSRHFSWRSLPQGFGIHLIRAALSLLGVFCMVIALTTLPLATANAVFYLAPLLIMLFAWLGFKERLTLLSISAVASGLIGTLVILQPLNFGWGALAALGGALSMALNSVLVRLLPDNQTSVQQLLINALLMLPLSAIFFGIEWQLTAPGFRPDLAIFALTSGVLIICYNWTVLLAYRHVAANAVTSAEYTGLIWAILIGWLAFAETPGLGFLLGSAMIVVPLVALSFRQHKYQPY